MENSQTIQQTSEKTNSKSQPLRFYGLHIVKWKNNPSLRRVLFSGVVIENKLCISIAQCGPRDNFSKVKAREIADSRIKSKEFILEETLNSDLNHKDLVKTFISLCTKSLKPNGLLDKIQEKSAKEAARKEVEYKLKKVKKS